MIDIQPPEHGIHGKRDFLVHLFTITIGLLIALGLENAVEFLHHRHQRDEAQATIRRELSDNRTALIDARKRLLVEQQDLTRILHFLQARSAGKPADPHGLLLRYEGEPYGLAAWKTASATGVLNYMDYDQVQTYATAYQLQEQYDAMQVTVLNDYLELESFVVDGVKPEDLTPEDVKAAIPDVRESLAHLIGLTDVGTGLLQSYDAALK
jgi:hypothetical protein